MMLTSINLPAYIPILPQHDITIANHNRMPSIKKILNTHNSLYGPMDIQRTLHTSTHYIKQLTQVRCI
jgi:hypothetical protein